MKTRRMLLSAATIASMTLGTVLPAIAASEPVVGVISPTTATINGTLDITATYNDPDGVAGCDLYVDGASKGAMTLSGGADSTSGTAKLNTAFGVNGGVLAQVRCKDTDGNFGVSAMTMITVAPASPPAPVVGAVQWGSGSVTAGTAATLTATYSDTDTVSSCELMVDDSTEGSLTLASGTATLSHTFSDAGQVQAQIRCTDAAGNVGHGPVTLINVGASGSASGPVIGSFSPSLTGTVNQPISFSATYSDSDGMNNCRLFVDGTQTNATVTLSGGSESTSGNATASHTFTTPGIHTGYFRCVDADANSGSGALASFSVYAAGTGSGSGSGDTTAPSAPSNLTVQLGNSATPTFNWTASADAVGVTAYETSIDSGAYVRGGTALSFMTSSALTNGPHTFSVRAVDAAGNVSGVATVSFVVAGTGTTPTNPPLGGVIGLDMMKSDALFVINNGTRGLFETANGKPCEWSATDATAKVSASITGITNAEQRADIENFAACGTGASMKLGAGERLGIVNSFRAAFGRLPSTQEDWFDVIKIGNGRFPGQTNAEAEARAEVAFKKVYLRDADTSVTADNNAITVMAYGLRPLPRNLNSEAAAIVTFKAVYGRNPTSANDWDIVRATAYSGATR